MTREELLAKWSTPTPALDHGHVRLVDVMGDDERVEQVARLSYQKGTRQVSETRSLLRYLIRHRHTSPLEQAVITLDMKMPIFVARQLVRHRTQSINELSGRYSEMPEEYYVPDEIYEQSTTNKQGRGEQAHPAMESSFRVNMRRSGEESFALYARLREEHVARETARIVLPLSTYTQWCTTMNLHNLLHMLELRLDPHAQWECRQYAEAIAKIVQDWCPIIWEAFVDYRLEAVTFSREEAQFIRATVQRDPPDEASLLSHTNLSKREIAEFLAKLGTTP